VKRHFCEIWQHRSLVLALVWRELGARYRGSTLGFLWTLANPMLQLGVYTLLFGIYLNSAIPHYPVFLFVGLLPWTWFSGGVQAGALSIVSAASLVTKARLPPQVFPVVAVVAQFVNFGLSMLVALPVVAIVTRPLDMQALQFLPLIALQALLTYAVALSVAALSVRFRDVIPLTTSLLTFWFFITPIVYGAQTIPARMRTVAQLNPMAVLVEANRAVLLEGARLHWTALGGVLAEAVVLIMLAVLLFERMRPRFAEVL